MHSTTYETVDDKSVGIGSEQLPAAGAEGPDDR